VWVLQIKVHWPRAHGMFGTCSERSKEIHPKCVSLEQTRKHHFDIHLTCPRRLKCKFYRLKCKFYRLKCKIYRLKCEFYRLKCEK
jgi:hypothetical protein